MKHNKRFFVILYSVTFVLFAIYMLFLSKNNIWKHRGLNEQIKNLDKNIANVKNQISNDYTFEEMKNDSNLIEQYAREQLNLQKNDEDVFIVVY